MMESVGNITNMRWHRAFVVNLCSKWRKFAVISLALCLAVLVVFQCDRLGMSVAAGERTVLILISCWFTLLFLGVPADVYIVRAYIESLQSLINSIKKKAVINTYFVLALLQSDQHVACLGCPANRLRASIVNIQLVICDFDAT